MSEIARFSISLEDDLLEQFDLYWRQQQFATRSEAVSQLLREILTKEAWAGQSKDAAGTLTLVFDHHHPQLRQRLVKLQHDHHSLIVSTMHVHLTHTLCLEVIVLRGPSAALQKMASQLKGLKGIYKGELVMANAEES
jgi:CopG family transcriptional regulator, nickel-responsive regulator